MVNTISGNTLYEFSDMIRLYTLELPKIKKCDEEPLNLWMKFFKVKSFEELELLYKIGDKSIREAVDMLKELSEDKDLYYAELNAQIARMDKKALLRDAREQGLEQGREQGLQRGLEQGLIKTARAMLDRNSDITFISKVTGLSKEQIARL